MGISPPPSPIRGNWIVIQQTDKNYSIVRDKSGRQGQLYEVVTQPQAILSQQLKIYQLRNDLPHQIIAVYGYQAQDQFGLCSSSSLFRIITEHLCVRFSQPFELNVEEVLYVLIQAIRGFTYLYSQVGCFHITQNMIGLTTQGQVRVWMHENYGQNSPQFYRKSITTLKIDKYESVNQEQVWMITQIFAIIAKHTNKLVIDKYLSSYNLARYNFKTIKDLFKDMKQKYQIQLLKRIDIMKKRIIKF